MPFKKICAVEEVNNYYILNPYTLLDDLCDCKAIHQCNDFNTDNIFDLRRFLVNNQVKRSLNFYLHLFDENKNQIEIPEENGYSLIYNFNRKSTRVRRKFLRYYPFISKNKLEVRNDLISLGASKVVTNMMIAYETASCFSSYFSDNGGGFYGFKFKIDTNVKPKYAVLYGYQIPINLDSYIEESDDSTESLEDSYGQYIETSPYNVYVPQLPSAPNIGYAMATAPPCPDIYE
tara:strand:- start:298 stop:996 length:699 start_codon:yes stop_codon:yes gene_type:complete